MHARDKGFLFQLQFELEQRERGRREGGEAFPVQMLKQSQEL
jgi:hypothetical protein